MTVRIQVYTQMGQCIWEEEMTGMSECMEQYTIYWNLYTNANTPVVPGSEICKSG